MMLFIKFFFPPIFRGLNDFFGSLALESALHLNQLIVDSKSCKLTITLFLLTIIFYWLNI
jgi:hypothetical protein